MPDLSVLPTVSTPADRRLLQGHWHSSGWKGSQSLLPRVYGRAQAWIAPGSVVGLESAVGAPALCRRQAADLDHVAPWTSHDAAHHVTGPGEALRWSCSAQAPA